MNNRLISWGLAFSAGLNLVLIVMIAQHLWQGSWATQQTQAAARSPLTHTLMFDEKRLGLTAQQREQFQEIRNRWLGEERQAKADGVQRIKKISELLVRDDSTSITLAPIFAQIRSHSDDFFVRLTTLLEDYREVLNPQQRALFNKMLQERFDVLQSITQKKNSEYEQQVRATMTRDKRNAKKTANPKNNPKTKGVKKARPTATPQPGGGDQINLIPTP